MNRSIKTPPAFTNNSSGCWLPFKNYNRSVENEVLKIPFKPVQRNYTGEGLLKTSSKISEYLRAKEQESGSSSRTLKYFQGLALGLSRNRRRDEKTRWSCSTHFYRSGRILFLSKYVGVSFFTVHTTFLRFFGRSDSIVLEGRWSLGITYVFWSRGSGGRPHRLIIYMGQQVSLIRLVDHSRVFLRFSTHTCL